MIKHRQLRYKTCSQKFDLHKFVITNLLLPQEQKRCRRKSRGTNDLLFIDEMIMREVKMRKRNLSVAWIDYKKVYDMPNSWMIVCLETVGIMKRFEDF